MHVLIVQNNSVKNNDMQKLRQFWLDIVIQVPDLSGMEMFGKSIMDSAITSFML